MIAQPKPGVVYLISERIRLPVPLGPPRRLRRASECQGHVGGAAITITRRKFCHVCTFPKASFTAGIDPGGFISESLLAERGNHTEQKKDLSFEARKKAQSTDVTSSPMCWRVDQSSHGETGRQGPHLNSLGQAWETILRIGHQVTVFPPLLSPNPQ